MADRRSFYYSPNHFDGLGTCQFFRTSTTGGRINEVLAIKHERRFTGTITGTIISAHKKAPENPGFFSTHKGSRTITVAERRLKCLADRWMCPREITEMKTALAAWLGTMGVAYTKN